MTLKKRVQNITNFFQLQIGSGNGKFFLLKLPIAFCLLFEMQLIASAQIVPDNTLPNNSVVTSNGNVFEIVGGTGVGSNLFHSFKEFSVPTGGTAFFNNAPTIENIISRVTGGSVSNIDGLIRANGAANLFLLNPNGIIFGPNAALNIGGSLIGSTANSIKFADGSEFSATNPQTSTLLTVNVPLGLQYGSNPGKILVLGPGNNLSLNPQNFETVRDNRPVGLQVQPGQTLALVGGNVALEGGNLTATGGRIELGGVNQGMVKLTPTNPGWSLSYQDIRNFQEISLSQAASVDTSGSVAGNIQVQGRRITLTDGSAILADTLGSEAGGMLSVQAEELSVIGTAANNPFYTSLFVNVASLATGYGGNLTIETGRLQIANGAQVGAIAFGSGQAGNVTVKAFEVELTGGSPFGPSAIVAGVAPGGSGNAGKLTIETGRLRLTNGAQVSASTFGLGNAGDLTVRTKEVELIGSSPRGASTGLFANVESGASGIGGNLTIETERLRLVDGAQVSVGTVGFGNAGNLTVRATEVEAIGISLNKPSGLFTPSGATGTGGNLTIDTERLRVADGAQIAASTFGSGNAGELVVRATDSVELIGTSPLTRSGLFANAIVGTGNGGDLRISTPQLTIRDGATISASNFSSLNPNIPPGQGKPGNITILADKIQSDRGEITATSNESGGGDINLTANLLLLRNQSLISTSVLDSTGGGGNITINSDFLVASENSDIRANAVFGPGGNIQINTKGVFLSPDSEITASSQLGVDGVVDIKTPDVDLSKGLVDLPQGVIDVTKLVAQGCSPALASGKLIVTGRGGMPPNPSGVLSNETVLADLGTAAVQTGKNNSSSAISTHPTSPPTQIVEAQGWVVDANGQVILTASAPKVTSHSSWLTNAECNH